MTKRKLVSLSAIKKTFYADWALTRQTGRQADVFLCGSTNNLTAASLVLFRPLCALLGLSV